MPFDNVDKEYIEKPKKWDTKGIKKFMFAFGTISQTLIIHMIRTHKIPFIQSKSSKQLLISTFVITIITLLITFSNMATLFDLSKLPYMYVLWMIGLLCVYIVLIQLYKKVYSRRNKEWL